MPNVWSTTSKNAVSGYARSASSAPSSPADPASAPPKEGNESKWIIHPQTLGGSFSSVSKPIFASKYAFCSIFRDLQDLQTFAPLQIQNFSQKSSNFFRKWVMNWSIFFIFALNFAVLRPKLDEFFSEFRQFFQKISKFVENLMKFQKKCSIFPENCRKKLENCEIIQFPDWIIHWPP